MARKKKTLQEYVADPPKTILDQAKEVLNERFRASKRIVNAKKRKWSDWDKMYKNEQIQKRIVGESNLVLPKADYISEVISSKIINSIFSVADWITLKHPGIAPAVLADQQKWFMWVLDRRVNFYLTAIEMFKSSPIKGTSICKVYMRNFWPYVEYIDLEAFYPDPLARKPGDVQSMRYCMHQFKRDLNQLKRFKNAEGKPIYLNLDKLEEQAKAKKTESVKMAGVEGVAVEDKISAIFDVVEYHGEFEFAPNQIAEFIITGTLKDSTDDQIDIITRVDPSTFKVKDSYSDEIIFYKPFVANIYSVNPGEFYGKSAISSVESLINEQTDLHNIYMDNHKRLVNGITKVLNRSNLTRNDLPQTAGAIWYLDALEDVEVETPQETNLIAYKQIHELLDREIEKASSVTSYNLGVGRTKRETYGEVRSMITEAQDRFQLFIQMADRTTLRPIATRVWALLRQTFDILGGKDFIIGGQKININQNDLVEDMDVAFAATAVESEHSKYSKQQTFPQVLQILNQIAAGRLNVDEIVREVGDMFNFKNPQRFVLPTEMIPINALPPQLQEIARQIAQQLSQNAGRGQIQGLPGGAPQLSAPSATSSPSESMQ